MSANIMQPIPDTFCSGKWEELCFNLNYNYVYGCCAAKPMKFVKDYREVLDAQKTNLLDGIRDESCNYCWSVEAGGKPSRRNEYTDTFDGNLEPYRDNTARVKLLELNIGNECNFQCVYCNPKYSSLWEADVRKQPYKIFTDRFNYGVLAKSDESVSEANVAVLKQIGFVEEVRIIGGEPLYNKKLWSLLDNVDTNTLHITTNLSCKPETLDRLFATKFKRIRLQISLDAPKAISEFARFGTDYELLMSNLHYALTTAPEHVTITIASTFSSLTIRGIREFTELVKQWQTVRPTLIWTLNYCRTPNIQSFYTLPDHYRADIRDALADIKKMPNIERVEIVESALENYKFSTTMHKELKHFFQQFAERKNIEIPICLD
jgi:molybdenum cofactor biosynthesis enzyme MoaA